MEATAQHDEQFLKWILSREAETYWAFDRHGKRLKLKAGWGKAQEEYDRIVGAKGYGQTTDNLVSVVG